MGTSTATKVSVTTAPTALTPAGMGSAGDSRAVLINIPTAGQTVYVGGATVDTTSGFPLPSPQLPVSIWVSGGQLYGIVTATSQNVNVLI